MPLVFYLTGSLSSYSNELNNSSAGFHSYVLQGYNVNMIELNQFSQGDNRADLDAVNASVKRLSEKVQLITEAVKELYQNRTQLQGKIEDAQKHIQHILSRLPDQGDGRQLNLLSEVTPPNTLEDDSEPTTH